MPKRSALAQMDAAAPSRPVERSRKFDLPPLARIGPNRKRDLELAAVDIAEIREKSGMSQRVFATRFGLSLTALRHWERGDRNPTDAALTLLHLIRENPGFVMNTISRIRYRQRQERQVLPEPTVTPTRWPP